MKVLLESVFAHLSSDNLYRFLADRLRAEGCECTTTRDHRADGIEPASYDLFLSHGVIPDDLRGRTRCLGGKNETRVELLSLLEECDVPTAIWSQVPGKSELKGLFDGWRCDIVLCKRSFTAGGKGVTAFRRESIEDVEWDPVADVFCPEINRQSGDVYKAEIFGGMLIISWWSRSPPLSALVAERPLVGPGGAYGVRDLIEFEAPMLSMLRRLSAEMTRRGYGYCSVDFMAAPNGDLFAIEINTELVATWWTSKFEFVRDRYACALSAWLRAHS